MKEAAAYVWRTTLPITALGILIAIVALRVLDRMS